MRFNVPGNGIAVPKDSDEWLKKIVVLALSLMGSFYIPPPYYWAVLAFLCARVYINDEELRVRAFMINVMDHELVEQSAVINELQERVRDLSHRLNKVEMEVDIG